MDENQKRPQASLEFINLVEDVYNNKNPQLPEYLDFLQDVEFLKKSETFQKSSAIFENFDRSVRIVWDIPEKYFKSAAYLAIQKMSKNAIPINFCDLSVERFSILQDCVAILWQTESELDNPLAKRICM